MQKFRLSRSETTAGRFGAALAGLIPAALSLGVAGAAAAPAPPAATATHALRRILRDPQRLELVGSAKSKRTFFFRASLRLTSPQWAATVLVASRAGRVAAVTYSASGLPYAYYGNGLFAIVDTRNPGSLDVLLGASPGVIFGASRLGGRGSVARSTLVIKAVPGSAGAVALDLSVPLRDILARKHSVVSFWHGRRSLLVRHGEAAAAVDLAPREAECAVRSLVLRCPGRSLSIFDITPGALPTRKLFGVTLAKLRASGVPLRIYHYRPGIEWRGFPPPGFGSAPGEAKVAGVLARLMPISQRRSLEMRCRWLLAEIAVAGGGGHGATDALLKLFKTLEWGSNRGVDFESDDAAGSSFHHSLDIRWNFNRRAYHNKLVRAWGHKVATRLMRVLERLALAVQSTPVQRGVAIDLLSDIGPGPSDADWAQSDGPLARGLAATNADRPINTLLLALMRARWGRPITPHQDSVASALLADQRASLFFRTRAMEVLCFVGRLPYEPSIIVPLVESSVAHPNLCGAAPASTRYLYDLSLCRNGRKLLLEQWASPRSPLSRLRNLYHATFNRFWPGSPGYNAATKVALRVLANPACSPVMRAEAIGALARGPRGVFRRAFARLLTPGGRNLGLVLRVIAAKKDAAFFLPVLKRIFPKLTNAQKCIVVAWTVGLGIPAGSDASAATALIAMALRDPATGVVLAGLHCIGFLTYNHVRFPAAQLYPDLLYVVKAERDPDALPYALYCFGLATRGRWSPPAAGLSPAARPNCSTPGGRAWWAAHRAEVRASALRWAAAHPNYPNAQR